MLKIFTLAVAGASGTLARYGLGYWVAQIYGTRWPLGTFIVNALGCFLIGFLGTLFDEKSLISPEWRAPLLIGFLGAFTTYSSFAYETMLLLREGAVLWAMANIFGTLVLCFVSLYAGLSLAKWI